MNVKNPAIKRILADVRELEKHPSSRYFAAPLEDNMFEWHFTIRGPHGSDFEGGIYHGRILLSPDYPFKPPNIVFLTKNGRFEVGTKICLSISAYHEETWQPAWGVRTMLEAIISFMPSSAEGAIGALDWSKSERQRLAKESQNYCCSTCGLAAKLLSEPTANEKDEPAAEIAAQIAQLRLQGHEEKDTRRVKDDNGGGKAAGIPTSESALLSARSQTEAVSATTLPATESDLKPSIQSSISVQNTNDSEDTGTKSAHSTDDSWIVIQNPVTSNTIEDLLQISPPTQPRDPAQPLTDTKTPPAMIALRKRILSARQQTENAASAASSGPAHVTNSTAAAPPAQPQMRAAVAMDLPGQGERDAVDSALRASLMILSAAIFYLVYRQMDLLFGDAL